MSTKYNLTKLQSIEAVFQLDQLCSISYLDVAEYQIQSDKASVNRGCVLA